MTIINSSQSDMSLLSQTLNSYLGATEDSDSDNTAVSDYVKSIQSKQQSVASYGSASSSSGKAALQKALNEISKDKNGSITYKDIKKYQEELESEFSLTFRVAVTEKGVDPEQAFSLTLSPEGKVSVDCDDDNSKAVIENYLNNNKSVAEKFAYIQALSNLERARQVNGSAGSNYAVADASLEYQSAFLESFFNDSLDTNFNIASTLIDFKGPKGDTSYYTGLDISV